MLDRLSGRLRQFRNVSSYEAIFLSLGERTSNYAVAVSDGSHRATGLHFSVHESGLQPPASPAAFSLLTFDV
jgi:hypothetical protein